MRPAHLVRVCSLVLTACLTTLGPASSQSEWSPQKPVEVVVGVAAGGSLDVTARHIQKIWQDKKIVSVPTVIVNRVGGAGAVAWTSLASHAGDGHFIAYASQTLLTNEIVGTSPLKYQDFTPIAMLNSDYVAFVVAASSPIKDAAGLIARLKDTANPLRIGNAATAGNSSHIALARLAQLNGIDPKSFKMAIFTSGGQSMTNLLGGHVDFVVTASANAVPHMQASNARVLAIAAPARLPGDLAGVPTWKELGHDVEGAFWQGVIGPKGMSPDQVRYWDRVFAETVATPEWKEIVAKNMWGGEYKGSADTAAYLAKDYQEVEQVLKELDMAKR